MVGALERFGSSAQASSFEIQTQKTTQTGTCAARTFRPMPSSYRNKAYYLALTCFLFLVNTRTVVAPGAWESNNSDEAIGHSLNVITFLFGIALIALIFGKR